MLKPHIKFISLVILTAALVVLVSILAAIHIHKSRQGDVQFSGTFVQMNGKLSTG